jgi:hypothetical protein
MLNVFIKKKIFMSAFNRRFINYFICIPVKKYKIDGKKNNYKSNLFQS